MTFDLKKFKAGVPALTRSGKKLYFVHYDPSLVQHWIKMGT